jgi:hypothetical protein
MPFRGDPGQRRCSYCAREAQDSCRHCGRELCAEHLLKASFYLPVAECAPGVLGECSRPRGVLRRRAHRARALAAKLVPPRPGSRFGRPR